MTRSTLSTPSPADRSPARAVRARELAHRARARRRLAMAGFTLLEALIALGISGFGLIAVARLQISLQAESDLAKQLSEATFLGQRRIEELRAFQQVAAATGAQVAAGAWGYNNITSGTQTIAGTNATYTVTWAISDATASVPYKNGLVNVQWTDRNGAAQVATLSTMIGGSDPASSLGLTVPPAGTPIRKPKNRDLNVPVPAVDIGNGTSYFTPPGAPSTLKIIFSNSTGRVTKRCSGTGTDWTAWTCTSVDAYLVSGYISVSSSNLTLTSPIDVTISLSEGALDGCYDDSALATKTYSGYITYTCIVVGNDHDANAITPARWSGRSDITGISIGTASANNKVCRYSADYDDSGGISNPEHPASYTNVSDSLENQNFKIVRGDAICPSGTGILALVQHQP